MKLISPLLFSVLLTSNIAFASNDFFDCYVLPINDNISGAVGNDVQKYLKRIIKSNKVCDLVENEQVDKILQKHRNAFKEALEAQDVLKLIAKKTGAGSVIRADIEYRSNEVVLVVDVIDSMGRDYLYRNKHRLQNEQASRNETLAGLISSDVQSFVNELPYSLQVVETVGNEIILKSISDSSFNAGDVIRIEQAIKPINHPLLKQVVEFETKLIGNAEIKKTEGRFVHASMIDSKVPVKKGFWGTQVTLNSNKKTVDTDDVFHRSEAKIFQLGAALYATNPRVKNANENIGKGQKVDGDLTANAVLTGHLRLIRALWIETNIGIGSDETYFNGLIGFRYSPLVNQRNFMALYLGKEGHKFKYDFDLGSSEQKEDYTLLGLRGNYEFHERLAFQFDLNLDKDNNLSKMKLGLKYDYKKNYDIVTGLDFRKYKTEDNGYDYNYSSVSAYAGLIYKY